MATSDGKRYYAINEKWHLYFFHTRQKLHVIELEYMAIGTLIEAVSTPGP